MVETDTAAFADEVVRRVGAGSAGAVFSAKDRASGLVVAVKILCDPVQKGLDQTLKEEDLYERMVSYGSPAVRCVRSLRMRRRLTN